MHRRVPHVAAIYLGGVWTGTEIAGWAVDRFILSPHLEEVVFLALFLMLPAVLLLAYDYGAPGADPWTWRSLFGMGANLLLTVSLLAFFYGAVDLGAAQQTVRMAGLSGEMAERTVPKAEFRKRVGLFYFDAPADSLAALRRAVPFALGIDLMQDLFVTANTPAHFARRLRDSGSMSIDLPLALRRDIAEEYGLDYILEGTITRAKGPYRLTTVLRATEDLDVIAERTFEGTTFMPLLDRASIQLRRDLDIPSAHIEQTTDLPVAEITTSSLQALEQYAEGYDAVMVHHKFASGVRALEAAVESDPTFAVANLIRMHGYVMLGQHDQTTQALDAAQRHQYRLIEPFRYVLRANQLILAREVEAAQRSVEQWTTLYPYDTRAWTTLAQIQRMRGTSDEAAESLRRAVELDPGQVQMRLKVAYLLSDAGNYEEAIRELRGYTEEFPERPDGYTELGNAYEGKGDPEKALSAHEAAYVRAPNDVAVLSNLGEAHLRLGQYAEAEVQLRKALTQSRSAGERSTAWASLMRYAWNRGQYQRYQTDVDSMIAALRQQYRSGYHLAYKKAAFAARLYRTGAQERARTLVDAAEAAIVGMSDQSFQAVSLHIAVGRYYVEIGQLDRATQHLDDAKRIASSFGLMEAQSTMEYHHVHGRVLEAEGRLDEAVTAYTRHMDRDPSDLASPLRIADIYRRIGRVSEAEEYYQLVLQRSPGTPRANLGYARLLAGENRSDEARAHLDRALAAWSKADPDFLPAREARALVAKLDATGDAAQAS